MNPIRANIDKQYEETSVKKISQAVESRGEDFCKIVDAVKETKIYIKLFKEVYDLYSVSLRGILANGDR